MRVMKSFIVMCMYSEMMVYHGMSWFLHTQSICICTYSTRVPGVCMMIVDGVDVFTVDGETFKSTTAMTL
jgi:hypothetical protein